MIWLEYLGISLGVWLACGLVLMAIDGYFGKHR